MPSGCSSGPLYTIRVRADAENPQARSRQSTFPHKIEAKRKWLSRIDLVTNPRRGGCYRNAHVARREYPHLAKRREIHFVADANELWLARIPFELINFVKEFQNPLIPQTIEMQSDLAGNRAHALILRPGHAFRIRHRMPVVVILVVYGTSR